MKKHIDYEEEAKYREWWLNNTGGTAAEGLTVRDYFAAKAMYASIYSYGYSQDELNEEASTLAVDSYKIADAMMKERAK